MLNPNNSREVSCSLELVSLMTHRLPSLVSLATCIPEFCIAALHCNLRFTWLKVEKQSNWKISQFPLTVFTPFSGLKICCNMFSKKTSHIKQTQVRSPSCELIHGLRHVHGHLLLKVGNGAALIVWRCQGPGLGACCWSSSRRRRLRSSMFPHNILQRPANDFLTCQFVLESCQLRLVAGHVFVLHEVWNPKWKLLPE